MTDGQIIVTALFFVFGILLVLFQHDSMFGATLIGIVIGRVLR